MGDLTELAAVSDGIAKVVLEGTQEMLLRLALQMARDDYETRRERQEQGIEIAKKKGVYKGRKPDTARHELIRSLRSSGKSIAETVRLSKCSVSLVKLVTGNQAVVLADNDRRLSTFFG